MLFCFRSLAELPWLSEKARPKLFCEAQSEASIRRPFLSKTELWAVSSFSAQKWRAAAMGVDRRIGPTSHSVSARI
jgi:hypothetical protein